jgi:hypothetical protein
MSAARWIRLGGLCALVLALAQRTPAMAQDKPAVSAAPSVSTPSYGAATLSYGVDIEDAIKSAGAVPAPMPTGPNKPGEAVGKSGPGGPGQPSGKPDDAKAKEAIPPVRRPPAPAASPNRDEFKIRPDAAGKVRLCFTGQPWQPVLEWLATISGMSLDWQELPGDSLNLTTRRSYSVPEVRDLINQHLLARGYTLLCHGEVLSVAEIKKLDPSLVPRVEPADLAKRDPHEFVKVSFPLEMFSAETAMIELKPMLSPNGKLFAMNETGRLEAMDAVLNLRDIDAVLCQQQARASQPKTFREFKLRYARAGEVHKLLTTLVSESPAMPGMPGQPGGMNPQQAAMMAQMQAQGGQPGQPQPNPAAAATKEAVTLAVNARNNSILVQAKPDKMVIIAQVIEALDVPADRNSMTLANMGRMQVYRLSGVDLDPVVKTLMDVGNLDPTTRLEIDRKNSAIIAYAPLADHVTIRALVDKLTGNDRKFEVIRLRRLAADYVAGTIESMLGSSPKKDQQQHRPWYFGDSPQDEKSKTRDFRVDADVEHNRLLLWANPVELAEVEALLVKLGEIPAGGNSATMRVIDSGDPKETQELLKRIQAIWPSIAPNALQAPAPGAPVPGAADGKSQSAAPPKSPNAVGAAPKDNGPQTKTDRTPPTRQAGPYRLPSSHGFAGLGRSPVVHFTDTRGGPVEQSLVDRMAAGRPAEGAQPAPPPVKITIGPDGKLVISSQDSQALDLMEQLLAELPAARKDYRIFHLKYALAVSVALNLEDFFKEKKEDRNRDMPWYYYEYSPPENDSQDDRRLSKRPKLKFISDVDTNTILVEGADARQLKTIEELILLYDQPPPSDSQSVRKTQLIHLKFSKAKAVADTIKDVYRDLLSANDKALAENNQGPHNVYNFGGSDTDSAGQKTPHFKGLLSIGVDENSNSLMISAPAFLFDHVEHMVQELDHAAVPEYEVRVVHIGSAISSDRVKDILDEVYNKQTAEKQPTDKLSTGKPANGPRNGGHNGQQ